MSLASFCLASDSLAVLACAAEEGFFGESLLLGDLFGNGITCGLLIGPDLTNKDFPELMQQIKESL